MDDLTNEALENVFNALVSLSAITAFIAGLLIVVVIALVWVRR